MINTTEKYRHELKYAISVADYISIRQRIKSIMKPDSYVNADGKYLIRSIYFDNYNDKVLREKLYGFKTREKFRIRYYNDDFSIINLEKKVKDNNLCIKYKESLTKEECCNLLTGHTELFDNDAPLLIKELICKMHSQLLRPKVLVSYTREPFVFPAGNVRITFDSNIRSSLYSGDFLENISNIPVTESEENIIMEIKYDEFLPSIIKALVQTGSTHVQAFSKYAASRKYC